MASKTFSNISKEKQDRVLRAAQVEFAANGYHKANINDICERAGISNGALYKYFKNKSDLYEAVIMRQVEGKDEYMRSVVASDASCLGKIRMLMENTQTDADARNDTFRILLQLGTSDMDSFARKVTRRIEATSVKYFRAILTQGIERGEVRSDIDVPMIAHIVGGLCFFLYSGFVSTYHSLRLEEYFGVPFTGKRKSHTQYVDRMLGWLEEILSPAERPGANA
ncbi:MAG: TetR/AcrR family transcriptional regulator [Candidatus Abyssobacteria bacterium SURF_5]|uniref:TetR/AcrR family transcriptional regulator n=1 Tax=Abyssobacteria bacterium (strain SURF_5) TaxID=2093360 RepID=A0A3A4NKU7_ABYX5|nr:MAG: TetR/AcrR family transcriptional regulator [Candidatus Abyssubacteria bacterium SURF_5]